MQPRRKRVLILALASVAGLGISLPAIGSNAPESLLPPGFGDQQSPPKPATVPNPAAPGPAPLLPPNALAPSDDQVTDGTTEEDAEEAEKEKPVELPDEARRSIDLVGPLTPDVGGLSEGAFGRADGRFLTRLMRRLDAPIASRWASILLRRALLTRVPTPSAVGPADWIAERAWLLLRMGEADSARLLVETVDIDRFSPKLIIVGQQMALATSDPAALCPLTQNAAQFTDDKSWDYARAICASLAGDGPMSSMFLDRARGRAPRNIDYLLTEKVVGAGTNARRAAHIEWEDVDQLNSWRFGLASAVGLEIPDRLLKTAGPGMQAWRARSPMYHPEDRIDSARIAASLGVFSNADLVDMYGQIAEREGDVGRDAPAARLRLAYVGDDANARMDAIRSFWDDAKEQPGGLYAAQILTARAAAGLAPSDSFSSDYSRLIATMLTAGFDVQASRWAPLVQASSPSVADEAWALLAVGSPKRVVDLSYARIDGYGARLGADGVRKMQMLLAGLGGLGRLTAQDEASLAENYGLPIARETPWTRAIDRAAERGEPATVALLAAVGMQTTSWRGVPPLHLYHIVGALKRTGNTAIARMIAAEALTRL
jgi:hypothetical protein